MWHVKPLCCTNIGARNILGHGACLAASTKVGRSLNGRCHEVGSVVSWSPSRTPLDKSQHFGSRCLTHVAVRRANADHVWSEAWWETWLRVQPLCRDWSLVTIDIGYFLEPLPFKQSNFQWIYPTKTETHRLDLPGSPLCLQGFKTPEEVDICDLNYPRIFGMAQ